MALIIGIIGSLIAVYSVRYMETYHHHHPEVRDRQKMFFFVIFAFLAAMFGLVFSNNLMWVFFFWEITTISSFLLIGYSETDEATRNAFRALVMNLLGGVAFVAAIIYLAAEPASGGIDLARVLASGDTAVILIPAVLIGFAGITKAALMPFSSWLLGAMVAPTPVSALLHSSTMVKAGVYILVRFAPVFAGTFAGFSVGLVGAVTFVVASAIAISQSNAKLVLAYSTIANLGLIAACAGVGTHMLVWAAILLIIFHAVAKSLLFLGTGAIEHRTGSRDIEDMEGLIVRMPKMAVMMFIILMMLSYLFHRDRRHVPCTVWYAGLEVGGDRGVRPGPLRPGLRRHPRLRERSYGLFLGEVDGQTRDGHPGDGADRERVPGGALGSSLHHHRACDSGRLPLPGHILDAD